MINSLLNFLRKKDKIDQSATPEGYCPNCWGRQEYGGQFLEAAKNRNVDVNSKNSDIGWIQDYANKHLSGIALQRKDDQLVCQKCKVTYKPS